MQIGPIKDGSAVIEGSGHRPERSEKPTEIVGANSEALGKEKRAAGETTTNEKMADNNREIDRLDEIRSRIDSGFYDQQLVKEIMVDRLLDEMLENINKFYK